MQRREREMESTETEKEKRKKKGLWSPEEDEKLRSFILKNGHGCWTSVPIKAGQTFSLFDSQLIILCIHNIKILNPFW